MCAWRLHVMWRGVAVLFGLGLSLVSSPSWACWDGFITESDHVQLEGHTEGNWSLREARVVARWEPRLRALLAPGDHLRMRSGEVYLCRGDDCRTIGDEPSRYLFVHDARELRRVFDRVADHYGRSRRERARAMAHGGRLYAVQMASFRDRRRARALANTIAGQYEVGALSWNPRSFYRAGGRHGVQNPAEVAAVIVRGQTYHRVIAGLFTDADEARAYVRHLADQGTSAVVQVEWL